MPSEVLTLDERVEHAVLMSALIDGEFDTKEMIAEILLWRRLGPAIRRNRYLMNNPEVRALMDRIPGSRHVPAANLPRYARR